MLTKFIFATSAAVIGGMAGLIVHCWSVVIMKGGF